MKKLLITLTVLALIAVGLDRGGVLVAEQVAASSLQSSQGLRQSPDVTIGGFPFLDQVAGSRYERVEVTARDLPMGEGRLALRLERLDLTLTGVTTSRDFSRIDVRRARADAVLAYADLGAALGIDLAFAGSGALRASRSFTVLGQTVEPSIDLRPRIVDGSLSLAEFSVNTAAELAGEVTAALEEVFGTPVPLQGIPFGVTVEGVRAERDGLHLTLVGSDLSYVEP